MPTAYCKHAFHINRRKFMHCSLACLAIYHVINREAATSRAGKRAMIRKLDRSTPLFWFFFFFLPQAPCSPDLFNIIIRFWRLWSFLREKRRGTVAQRQVVTDHPTKSSLAPIVDQILALTQRLMAVPPRWSRNRRYS